MQQGKYNFAIGFIIGIVVSAVFFQFFAPRYSVVQSGDMMIKQDKWSGDSWKMAGSQWEKIVYSDRNWELIDNALRDALRIPKEQKKAKNKLAILKKKYPVLADVPDKDLLERIKYMYPREILANLYFDNCAVAGEE